MLHCFYLLLSHRVPIGASCVTIWKTSILFPAVGMISAEQGPFTYGGDHCACKEETAPEVPVAGVGGVAFGVHAVHPGFQDDL